MIVIIDDFSSAVGPTLGVASALALLGLGIEPCPGVQAEASMRGKSTSTCVGFDLSSYFRFTRRAIARLFSRIALRVCHLCMHSSGQWECGVYFNSQSNVWVSDQPSQWRTLAAHCWATNRHNHTCVRTSFWCMFAMQSRHCYIFKCFIASCCEWGRLGMNLRVLVIVWFCYQLNWWHLLLLSNALIRMKVCVHLWARSSTIRSA